MLKDLWQWWVNGLTTPWPGAPGRWLRGERRLFRATVTPDGIELAAQRDGSWYTLWRTDAGQTVPAPQRRRFGAGDVVLCLPTSDILQRTISVPPHSTPRAYVEQRLDEFSPFPESECCFDVVAGAADTQTVLVIARRSDVERGVQRLNQAGLRGSAVTAEGFEHTPLDLAPADHHKPKRRDRVGAALLLAGLAACVMAVGLPFVQQSRMLQTLSAEKQALEQRLERAGDTRETLRQLRSRAGAIADRAHRRAGTVALLAEITSAVPDHSWVRQLILHDGTLTLHGESRDTADLIARLEASPHFDDVRYDAAITRDADSGTDRFKLMADTLDIGS